MHKATAIGATALALLAIPASAAASPTDSHRTNAAQECRAERGSTDATREAFKVKYGTNKTKSNAHGKCVSSKAKQHEAEADAQDKEQIAARRNAATTCAKERDELGDEAFHAKYGTNANSSNAFGKCVSKTAKAQHQDD